MRVRTNFNHPEISMKGKLFGYMLVLVLLLLLALASGLFFSGHFSSTEQDTYEALDIQMEIFEKDISTHFDHLAAAGIRLSEEMTILLEDYFIHHSISFDNLQNSKEHISVLQETMMEPLKQKLFQENCSGIFVMLNTTINSSLANADTSKTGIYLQINGYETISQEVLLYRGLSDIGKNYGFMPHRKWRLEFQTDLFPNYEELVSYASYPLERAFQLTNVLTMPGTSEKAILIAVPILSSDGAFYGICGFEVSESYFMTYHAQPSRVSHLTCVLCPGNENTLLASDGLSCGVADSYYRAPKSTLLIKNIKNGLNTFSGDTIPYIGITKSISLSPHNADLYLSAMMPKEDFDQHNRMSLLYNILMWTLLLFFSVTCCLFFSNRFLTPILSALEQIKKQKRTDIQTNIPEIDDLFAFLDQKDQEHEYALLHLMHEKEQVQNEHGRLLTEYEKAQLELSRLAYLRKQEVDPDDYTQFLSGIQLLTPSERRIFDYYLEGKTVKEIIEILTIKESTLRYHNKNIYSKLGVNSLKQLLRYAALMKQDS